MELENRAIEEIGNGILKEQMTRMFASGKLSLLPNETKTNQEKGIDMFFVVTEMNAKGHLMVFTNQNKSTEDEIKTVKSRNSEYYGKISFQLEVEDVKNFYYNIDEPLLFTRTFNNERNVFWYFIQLDTSIEGRVKEAIQQQKNTIQIYLDPKDKVIPQNFERFYSQLKECKIHQLRKKTSNNFLENQNYFNPEDYKGLQMADKLIKTINEFEPLKVLPFDVLKASYPFSVENPCVMDDYHLYSDNDELYEFLNKIRRDSNGLVIDDPDYKQDRGFKEKLEDILAFFHNNLIFHFSSSKKDNKKAIHFHDLFNKDICNCASCMMKRLDILPVQRLLEVHLSTIPENDKLNLAFAAHGAGEIKKAYEIYKDVFTHSNLNSYRWYIAIYNLQKIKSYAYHWATYDKFNDDEKEFLKTVRFSLSELSPKKHIPKTIEWLKNHKFIYYASLGLDTILGDVEAHFRNDKLGGSFRNQKFQKATFIYDRAVTFIEGNFLLFQHYQDFQIILRKYFEVNLALQNIRNPNSSKNDGISKVLIRHLILYLNPKEILRALRKYDIKNLKIRDSKLTEDYIAAILLNLTNFLKSQEKEKTNYLLKDTIDYSLRSLGILIGYIEFSSQRVFEDILESYFELSKIVKKELDSRFLDMYLILRKKTVDNIKLLEEFLPFWLKDDKLYDRTTYEILKKINEAGNLENHLESIRSSIGLDNDDFEEHFYKKITRYDNLIHIKPIRKLISEKIKDKALERLNQNFNPNYFYFLTIFKMIPLNYSLLEKFKDEIPDLSQDREIDSLFLKPRINESLSQYINLLLYYNIDINNSHRKLSRLAKNKSYYDWLMNLEGFNYSKFNIDWVLLYKTTPVLTHIKKSETAKHHILSSLKKDYTEGAAKIFIFNLLD